MSKRKTADILAGLGKGKAALLPALHRLRLEKEALGPDVLYETAAALEIPYDETLETASFYALCPTEHRPGVYEIPFSMTFRQLLELAGGSADGTEPCALQNGGSGGLIFADAFDTPYETGALGEIGAAVGTGSLIFVPDLRTLKENEREALLFFAAESCGRCMPCRIGLRRLADLFDGSKGGEGNAADIRRLAADIELAARCPLGAGAVGPARILAERFPELFEREEG